MREIEPVGAFRFLRIMNKIKSHFFLFFLVDNIDNVR